MNFLSLVHRKYREQSVPGFSRETGRAVWCRWVPDTGTPVCPEIYSWDYSKFPAGRVRELDDAVYVATLAVGASYPYAVQYVWAMPESREGAAVPDGYSPELPDVSNTDLYFVHAESGDWELYSVSGKYPSSVAVTVAAYTEKGDGVVQDYVLPVSYPERAGADPGFDVMPSTFTYGGTGMDCIAIGDLVYDSDAVASVVDARYDADCEDDDCLFFMQRDGNSYTLYTRFVQSDYEHMEFNVPVYIRYVDAVSGLETDVRKEFVVHGTSSDISAEPYVKYVRRMASRVGSYEKIEILGGNFTSEMGIRLGYGSDWSVVIPRDETVLDTEDRWDRLSFIMGPEYAMHGPDGEEICAVYDIGIGYGGNSGFVALAGTGDAKMALENNVGIIRYKYDEGTAVEQRKASAGAVVTTNSSCFYTTDIEMVYDSTDGAGNAQMKGGAAGKYGKTIYWKVDPTVDCENVRYVKVKLKYNRRLDYRRGEMTLDGVQLTDGDIVWLAGQMDGTDGLWVVRAGGDWEGLKDIVDPGEGGRNPCGISPGNPLPVDSSVFVDLGARVTDEVKARCSEDVPEKYGRRVICGREVNPGDIVLLAGQSDGMDGLWEVTCADWIYRGPVNDSGDVKFDASDSILYQNNIDFCACRDKKLNPIYGIEYYYLNAGCYLATATRKVKMICSSAGGLFPNNRAIVTDYSITAGAEKSLVVDTGLTAGDGVDEDCKKPDDDFDLQNGVGTEEATTGCPEHSGILKAPNCSEICDCPRFYTLPATFDGTTVKNGFSMVFWQFGDGGWHLYAYIAQKGVASSVSYYVYHLRICGIALPRMVDENTDVFVLGEDGLPTSRRTKDAWFVPHTGPVADGFCMYDPQWAFKTDDGEGGYVITHELGPETLYQNWSLHGVTTKMLAHLAKIGTGEVPAGMDRVYGFKFYHTVITKERFCSIYNEAKAGCICQDTWTGLVTDQCYDEDGHPVDCDEAASRGNSFITTDDGEPIAVEKSCFDDTGRKIDCDQ